MLVTIAAMALAVTACGEGLEDSAGDDAGGSATEDTGGSGSMAIDECRDESVELPAGDESLDGATLTVGSKKFTENVILGAMATRLWEARGFRAQHRAELGDPAAEQRLGTEPAPDDREADTGEHDELDEQFCDRYRP